MSIDLPNDSSNIFIQNNFLSKETLDKTLSILQTENKELYRQTSKQKLYKFGNSIEYFHLMECNNDKNLLNENYILQSIKENEKLRIFNFLYVELKNKISNFLNINCEYHPCMFKPYIRIWSPLEKIIGLPLNEENNGFHYDSNIMFINYEKLFGIKPKNVISGTIMLETPEYTEFEYLPDTKTNDPKIYFDDKFNSSWHSSKIFAESRNKLDDFLDNRIIHRYSVNDLILQWNFMVHRIGKMKYSNPDQKRISLQFSGIHDGETIWLTS